MNFPNRLICLSALLFAPALFATDAFVGKITLAMSVAKGTPRIMTQTMKGPSIRIDTPDAPGAIIMDQAKGEMTIIMNQQGMYMVRPLNTAEIAKKAKELAPTEKAVEATGQTEKILGYPCSQILVTEDKGTTEIWVSDALGSFAGFGNQGGGGGGMFGPQKNHSQTASPWEQALKSHGGFPLRVVSHDKKGNETYRMEVTKIEKGGVTEKDFLPPEGFKKFDMGDMMGGMNPFR